MKFVDEFRNPQLAGELLEQIRQTARRPRVIMEVCGGQTHGLLRHGIDTELHGVVELIHGPGCPICVTDLQAVDEAQRLALLPNVVLCSFGDMLRVPGTNDSLLSARTRGAKLRTVYSPMDAVQYAVTHPDQHVVFFAVGFETTTPATALAVLQSDKLGLKNFTLLSSHVRVQPAMEMMMGLPDNRVQGFLAAGHVCAVTGFQSYEDFARRHNVPVVVTGFEPVDLLQGILDCVRQLESGRAEVTNRYGRAVTREGNREAQRIVESVYEICDLGWRGLGEIPAGGYRLRAKYAAFDAAQRFPSARTLTALSSTGLPSTGGSGKMCRAGEVLSGRLKPCDCAEFGHTCTPDSPLGSPMVSSEGACAAYYRYHQRGEGVRNEKETIIRSVR